MKKKPVKKKPVKKAAKRDSKTFWLSRENDTDGTYNVCATEPEFYYGIVQNYKHTFCPGDFERLTGIKLRKGQSIQVALVQQ